MIWAGLAVLGIVVAALLVRRRRTLTATWAWNATAIRVVVGLRSTEISVAEVRAISATDTHLFFETARGELAIEARWVTPSAVTMLSAACGQTRAGVVRAMNSPRRTELWRGEAGSFRVPTSA